MKIFVGLIAFAAFGATYAGWYPPDYGFVIGVVLSGFAILLMVGSDARQ
jgi:hypothetical protein